MLARLVFAPNDEVLLLRILGLSLLVAGAAAQLNISATVGAFLVDLSLSVSSSRGGSSAILRPLRDLFAAVFFVFFGLKIDPATIPDVAPAAIALAVVSAATKVATGWWAAGRGGVSRRGRLRAGVALIPRGEFSIVIAGPRCIVIATLAAPAVTQPEFQPLVGSYVLLVAIAGPLTARATDRWTGRHPSAPSASRRGASDGASRRADTIRTSPRAR